MYYQQLDQNVYSFDSETFPFSGCRDTRIGFPQIHTEVPDVVLRRVKEDT